MERLLKYLSVFLISLSFFCLNGSIANASESATKEDYDYLYSCMKANGSFSGDVGPLAGKYFEVYFNPLECDAFSCSGDINTFTTGSGTFVIKSSNLTYYDAKTITTNHISFSFKESTGSFYFNIRNDNVNLKPEYLPLSEWPSYPKEPEPEPEPEPEQPEIKPPEFNSGNVNPPKFDVGDGSTSSIIDGIINVIVDFFKELSKSGIKIIKCAIALGVIFVGGKWLWRKLRQWLNNI